MRFCSAGNGESGTAYGPHVNVGASSPRANRAVLLDLAAYDLLFRRREAEELVRGETQFRASAMVPLIANIVLSSILSRGKQDSLIRRP